MKAMMNSQLELTLESNQGFVVANRRASEHRGGRRSRSRAQWWFERMREVVDAAFDWESASRPQPEQMVLPGSHRLPLVEVSGQA